jgi:hypothetical protein
LGRELLGPPICVVDGPGGDERRGPADADQLSNQSGRETVRFWAPGFIGFHASIGAIHLADPKHHLSVKSGEPK